MTRPLAVLPVQPAVASAEDPTARALRRISGYHAHVYYDDASRATAARVRKALGESFEVELGRWHDRPIGPHPRAMYQVAFPSHEFARIVPWLMLNRGGLTVLVHPETGDAVADHGVHALWLGEVLPIRFERLQ